MEREYWLYSKVPGAIIFSGVDAAFETPNEAGLLPDFERGGAPFNSAKLDRNQYEASYYGIVVYQPDTPAFSLLAAEVNSDSSTRYEPDRVGDLLFTGVASDARRSLLGTSGQLDNWRRFQPEWFIIGVPLRCTQISCAGAGSTAGSPTRSNYPHTTRSMLASPTH